jgi:hypothetical protein
MVDKAEQEVWQNSSQGMVGIVKLDRRGEITAEAVNGGAKFSLSVEERLLNQDRAASKDQDLFLNGTLVPIRLIETAEGAAEIAHNPNIMAESEMQGLFKLHWKKFETSVGEITNEVALRRLRSLAEEHDATLRQVQVIDDRLAEVAPQTFVEVSSVGSGATAGTGERQPKAVTPR